MSGEERRGLIYVLLAVGVLSTSPILVVWADPLPALIKTWGRLAIAAVAVGALALVVRKGAARQGSGAKAKANSRVLLRYVIYGLVAASHFYCYVASLDYTTAAHALSLVYTAPIFVTLLSAAFLREPVKRRQWLGVLVAVLGIAILAGLEQQMSPEMAFGDFLALLSAVTYGLYSVAGRFERDRTSLLAYASRVYGSAALWLLPLVLISFPAIPSVAWGWQQVLSVVALGLGPLALGHTLYNASLRRVHATYVNIVASQEVTGGILLAFLLLGQVPSPSTIVGAVVTLIGIIIVLR